MKKVSLIAAIIILVFGFFLSNNVYAQPSESDVGLGLMVGEPTGLTFKAWTSDINAFDVGMAWSVGNYDAISIHADYLWHRFGVFNEIDSGQMPVYYGIGGRLVLGDPDTHLGARIPIGIAYLFEESPVELFLEVAPIVDLVPETDFDMNGALGVRLYL